MPFEAEQCNLRPFNTWSKNAMVVVSDSLNLFNGKASTSSSSFHHSHGNGCHVNVTVKKCQQKPGKL